MRADVPTLVDEDQAQIVPSGVLLVDFAEGGCEVEASEEQPDGDCLACVALAM